MKKYLYRLAAGQTKGPLAFFLKFILWILSLVYFLGVRTVYYLYALGIFKRYRLAGKVISVGNITWGGTGKTPVVVMLAKYLVEQGKRPAVLSRGYKRVPSAEEDPVKNSISNGVISYKRTGDEALCFQKFCPCPF